jgi:hypothetical protein
MNKYTNINVLASDSSVTFKLVKKLCSTWSLLNTKYTIQNAVLPKEELDNNEAKLENSAHKSLTQLA